MKRRDRRALWTVVLILCMVLMTGCAGKPEEAEVGSDNEVTVQESSGTLILKVNPEIAVDYDENGRVTAVYGRNEDGRKIVENYRDYIGKECHEAVEDLVGLIHEAGYFVEEVEGENRKIIIEIESGSVLPEEGFIDEIVAGVQTYVENMQLGSPVVAEDQTGDGATDFDIYEHQYGPEAYEVAVPSEKQSPALPGNDTGGDADINETDAAPDTGNPVSGSGTGNTPAEETVPGVNPPVHQESPYTDYETPYQEPESPYTDYETPYQEPESPYTDYETPYQEPESPYTDYETPYTETSSYTDYHDESPYEASHYGDSGYSHYH